MLARLCSTVDGSHHSVSLCQSVFGTRVIACARPAVFLMLFSRYRKRLSSVEIFPHLKQQQCSNSQWIIYYVPQQMGNEHTNLCQDAERGGR